VSGNVLFVRGLALLRAVDRTEVLTRDIDGHMPWRIAVMFRQRV
jgi:hypothetical protein